MEVQGYNSAPLTRLTGRQGKTEILASILKLRPNICMWTFVMSAVDGEFPTVTEKYNPYLTIRRNIQHADDDFTNVMWLHKVRALFSVFNGPFFSEQCICFVQFFIARTFEALSLVRAHF